MAYKRFTDEEVKRADNVSIVDYISKLNVETKKAGKTLKVEGYGGLYIDPVKNKWNCFSAGKGGGTIQLMMFLENKTWVEAIKSILNKSYADEIKPATREVESLKNKEFALPKRNKTYNHMIAYLIKTRKIDKNIVYKFIKNRTLYEDEKRNCVFVGYDKEDNPKYAGLRGTNTNIPFKGEVGGSNKAYSFNLKGNTNRLFVFESPIELMSYLTMQNHRGISMENHHMLSLGCLASVALERYLKENPGITEINLCLNNDKWGIKATDEIKEQYKDKLDVKVQLPELEDWNDHLVYNTNFNSKELKKSNLHENVEWDMEL